MKPTRLLDRWSMRGAGACPFAVVLRPTIDEVYIPPPFRTWRYTPPYLPAGLAIEVAEDVPLVEPAVFHLPFQRGRARPGDEPIDHAVPLVSLEKVTIAGPMPELPSEAARALAATGQVAFEPAIASAMTLRFSGAADVTADLRPELPLVLRW